MKRILCLLVFIGIFAAFPANAQKISIVTENWPPYNYTKNDEVIGVITEVVKAAFEKTDLTWSISVLPWAEAYKNASEQENTMIYTIFKLPEREKLFHWVKIGDLSAQKYLFSPNSRSDIKITSLEDAKKYRIGVTKESATHVFLRSKGFEDGKNIFPISKDIQNAFKADPSSQKFDLTTADKLSLALWLQKKHLPADLWKPELLLFSRDFYMAFGKKNSADVVKKVSKALKDVETEGTLEKILQKYEKMYQLR
ncbi:MAG: amino acid ABC transporter substrate-binding protein [Desulfobacteraceae bacterium]|nr:amino acid ABC transporter substrate-binding protein [Desulfobacteraceae bacterium]